MGSEAGLSTSGSPEPRKWGTETTLGLLAGAAAGRTADMEERQYEGRPGLVGHGESGLGTGREEKEKETAVMQQMVPTAGVRPCEGPLCCAWRPRGARYFFPAEKGLFGLPASWSDSFHFKHLRKYIKLLCVSPSCQCKKLSFQAPYLHARVPSYSFSPGQPSGQICYPQRTRIA